MDCRDKGASILDDLKDLVNQIDRNGGENDTPCSCCSPPVCPPCTTPYAQVIMTCPPPILAPTQPQPVRPLQLYCPSPDAETPLMSQREREESRYDNFYNYYNYNWHAESPRHKEKPRPVCTEQKQRGQTIDGSSPCCDQNVNGNEDCPDRGCPTGFKPCTMRLTPPPGCDPCGVWCAEVQPCPPKPRKSDYYEPGDALKEKQCK